MGTTYYDKDGVATFLFGNVPIKAVKKAFFTDKLGTVSQLLKMVYNSVTYDFQQTAENGAVIFANNFKQWDFIAPDNRLNFDAYENMTVGDALADIESSIAANPVPAWEAFARYLRESDGTFRTLFDGVTSTMLLTPYGTSYTVNNISWKTVGSFLDFIHIVQACLEPINAQPKRTNEFELEITLKI